VIPFQHRSNRRAVQVARSQLGVRLGLALYAALSTAMGLRILLLVMGFPTTVWSVDALRAISDVIVMPFTLLPGADRPLFLNLTLADISAALILLALPFPLLGRRKFAIDRS
jgi:hypothetical protein